jgi:membrane protease YdiL (CAAX protease family)
VGTPGSETREAALHPAAAFVAVAAGVFTMYVPIALAQAAAARGHVFGLRTLLVASQVALITPALIALLAGGRSLRKSLALGSPAGPPALVAVGAGVALWITSVGLLQLQSLQWPPTEEFLETFRRLHEALRPKDALDAVLSVLAIAIVPATCEEVLFRGVLLPSLARVLRTSAAVLASAAMFGVIHLDFTGAEFAYTRIPFAILVGVGFGLLRARSGSLVPPILAHAVLNTITFATVAVTGVDSGAETPEALLGATMLAGGTVLTAMTLRYARPPLTPPGGPPRLAA